MLKSETELMERLEHIESRLAALESAGGAKRSENDRLPIEEVIAERADEFWALVGLQERTGPNGGVLFTGSVNTPIGERFLWQQAVDTDDALDADWDERAGALAALGHPVRLALLQYVLLGVRTTAELAEVADVNTTGQLHHHLKDLVAARWLRSPSRGHYEIPVDRVIPLLAIVEAARDAG